MKTTSVILLSMLIFAVAGLFASNILLRKEYDRFDKNDTYWTYGKILEQPFKHVVVEGGNLTTIAFEPQPNPSVRVLRMWQGFRQDSVKATVRQDTLFLSFPLRAKDLNEEWYMGRNTLVRIFSPGLLSLQGYNTHFKISKFKQKSISIRLSGRSGLEVESDVHELDSLEVTQRDSSEVVFRMSPHLKGTVTASSRSMSVGVRTGEVTGEIASDTFNPGINVLEPKSWQTIFVRRVHAAISGASLLDLGHAQINSLQLQMADSSAIILSGGSLQRWKTNK